MDDLAVLASARALTGMIKAFELHADANPENAVLLRSSANTLRSTRDDLLSTSGITLEKAEVDYGAADEWCGAISRLTEGSSDWPLSPSRDHWAPSS